MIERKRVAQVGFAAAVFILISAVFSLLSHSVVISKSGDFDQVRVSDCASVGISMNVPPDMEGGEKGLTFFSEKPHCFQRTDIHFITGLAYSAEYNAYCGEKTPAHDLQNVYANKRCEIMRC